MPKSTPTLYSCLKSASSASISGLNSSPTALQRAARHRKHKSGSKSGSGTVTRFRHRPAIRFKVKHRKLSQASVASILSSPTSPTNHTPTQDFACLRLSDNGSEDVCDAIKCDGIDAYADKASGQYDCLRCFKTHAYTHVEECEQYSLPAAIDASTIDEKCKQIER